MKILILKPSSLGDVVQALPVLRLLKRHLPKSEIYWWIDSRLAPLLEGDPDLTGLIRFNRQGWGRPGNWARLWRDVRWVRAQRFDWIIDLQGLARSALFAWLGNGQLSIGLDDSREGSRGFYDEVVTLGPPETHAVRKYLAVLPRLKVPVRWDFEWLRPNRDAAERIRQRWAGPGARWIILQPGARWPNKRWPVDLFIELVKRFPAAPESIRFAVLGAREDGPLGAQIAQANSGRCLDLTGQLSLPEMVEWIRRCELMVTNDTGPMHVAAALAKPVVALFGPTDPNRTGPYGQPRNVLQVKLDCVPCLRPYCRNPRPLECLQSISPAAVIEHIVLERD